MRLNGHAALTIEDARTWIEETGLCLFLPKRQFSSPIAPSFLEAVIGKRESIPDPKHIALAEELLVRLETAGVAVRLNLLGLPGEKPDFVVASWVLPYVYALRGDRDWRRIPQLTGSRQVSQLAIQAYKQLELGDTTLSKLTQALGREVTEGAVLRAITELWQQLRIIPVVSAPGQPAQWQLLRLRFQKAIAEGASTSQVTAISVLASIYLQAVIAASMEEVELFLSPLTARSKIREVLRGLVATRQVRTISLGHAPLFYVAGTLPEFADPPTIFASASVPASAFFLRSQEREEELPETSEAPQSSPAESHAPRATVAHSSATTRKSIGVRPHFSRPASNSRDRKPSQSASSNRPARPAVSRTSSSARPASAAHRATSASSKRSGAASTSGNHSNGNHSSGSRRPAARPSGASSARSTQSSAAWSQHKIHSNSANTASKSSASSRSGSSVAQKASRPAARPAHAASNHNSTLATGAKAGNSKRFGFAARSKQGTKKRG
jgi:hypothetical protein